MLWNTLSQETHFPRSRDNRPQISDVVIAISFPFLDFTHFHFSLHLPHIADG